MSIGTVINYDLACDFGVLYNVKIHHCSAPNDSRCHDDLTPPTYTAVSKREKALLEIPGIFGARLTGTTLYLAIKRPTMWYEVWEDVDAVMRSS